MKAAFKTDDRRFEITQVEPPIAPTPGFLVARVRAAGICGTDLWRWTKAKAGLARHFVGHRLARHVVEAGDARDQTGAAFVAITF